ncbi:MAG: fibrobacter succinogenes major paralogous domain-containing protein [Saprospiraceae bacterium]|nr:fibrobacter succinogenes major paralogous domain-containing protein [Saprospiraceae bacterium]
MMRNLMTLAVLLLPLLIGAQNLEVQGKAKITEMDKVNTADSVVVRLADGTLGVRDKSTLTHDINDPVNAQDATTKAYVDALITQLMNDFANSNETFTSPTTGTVTDSEGNGYNILKIGGEQAPASKSLDGGTSNVVIPTVGPQWWMVENLRATKYNDGTPIPLIIDSMPWAALSTPGHCWYNNDSLTNAGTYGALYNYYAVADTNSRNVCPSGWHVSTDSEWKGLENYLKDNGYGYGGNASFIAKSLASQMGWNYSVTAGTPGNDQVNNNSSGFTGFAGGCRNSGGSYADMNRFGYWWCPTELDFEAKWHVLVFSYASLITNYSGDKPRGFSIRCVRD